MKLHIVMPVINCLDLTKQAYASIKSKVPFNFILIDNASDDGTREWAFHQRKMAYPPAGNDFQYVRNEPSKSVAASWNQGIKIAFQDPECKYVAILNNDIILHEKTLDHLMAFMRRTGYIMVTGDNVQERMSPESMSRLELPNAYTDFDVQEISEWRAEGPDFSCFLINRDTIDFIGDFDEHFLGAYCEDWDYHARINRAWRWAKQYGDPPEHRMHAKRLSTAPYYHFSSQTLRFNPQIRNSVSKQHGANNNYYTEKWGGDHPFVMDGNGNVTPWGDARLNWKAVQKI